MTGKNGLVPMEGKTFRLGEYRITDFGSGLINWEAHHDLGEQRSGRCHRLREVLVLGEFEQEKSGYLKGEFLDLLKSLPPWTLTRYFCLASHLHVVGTGRRPDKDLLAEIGYPGIHQESVSKQAGDKKTETFRLGRYRITFAPNNEFSWEALGNGNKIVTGNCTLESGILLMGTRQGIQEEQNKREYVQQLRRLPLWNRTRVWGLHDVLQSCQVPAKSKIDYFIQRLPPTPKRGPFIKKTAAKEKFGFDKQPEKIQQNRIKCWKLSLPASLWSWRPKRPNFPRVCSFFSWGFKLPTLPGNFFRWSRLIKPGNPSITGKVRGKDWIIWLSLVLVGLLLALIVTTLYLVNKKSHGHYHSREHNHRSKDH
jgi:hypothetical protein